MNRYDDEEIRSKLWLITQCIAELREHLAPNYTSRAYELLINDFNAKEITALDKYFTDCLRSDTIPTKSEFIERVKVITNNNPINEATAEKILLAYQKEELFLKVVGGILNS